MSSSSPKQSHTQQGTEHVSITKLVCIKVAMLFSDPQVATAFWGAIGGVITAIIRRRSSIWELIFSVVIAASFATWFAQPLVEYFALPASASNGVSAVLGISSYEIVRGLAHLKFSEVTSRILARRTQK